MSVTMMTSATLSKTSSLPPMGANVRHVSPWASLNPTTSGDGKLFVYIFRMLTVYAFPMTVLILPKPFYTYTTSIFKLISLYQIIKNKIFILF